MQAPGDDHFFTELRACTAELARIIDGDLERPVPTCPGWTFRQLATHLGRGHRWAAQIVAARATAPIPQREVADGKLPEDPAEHAHWLNAGAGQVIEAVTVAGSDLVWTPARRGSHSASQGHDGHYGPIRRAGRHGEVHTRGPGQVGKFAEFPGLLKRAEARYWPHG